MKRTTVATPASVTPFRIILAAALAALLGAHAAAQTTGARPDRGLTPGASYSASGLDSVSLTNGNVSLSVPLASLPPLAGGRLGLTLSAVYNSKLWNVRRVERRVTGVTGFDTYVEDTPELSDLGGWRVTGRYQIVLRDASEDYSYQTPPNQSMTTADDWAALQYRWYKAVLVTPDGAEHELRPTLSDNYYGNFITGGRDYLRNYYRDTPDTKGAPMRYHSFDGSYLSAVIYPREGTGRRWELFMPDGTQVVQEADAAATQRITDTDGNGIQIYHDAGVEHYQDRRNPDREIKVSLDEAANNGEGQQRVSYKMVGGGWAHVVLNYGSTRVRGQLYRTGAQNGAGGTCQVDEELDKSFRVLREIVYPATEPDVAARRYSFGYNSDSTETFTTLKTSGCGQGPESYTTTSSRGLGALSRVVTPTGATIDYSYSLASTHHYLGVDGIAAEMITSKKVTHDGTEDTWNYDISPGQSHGTVHNPDGTYTTETAYQHNPYRGAFATQTGELASLVYRSQSAGVIVERRWELMPFAGANTRPAGSDTTNRVNFNPVVTEEYTTLTDDQGNALKMSAKTYRRDYNGNVTEVKEYDRFDPIPASGRDALGIPNSVPAGATLLSTTNTSYHNSPATDTSASVYAKRALTVGTPSVIDAPKETVTGPSVTRYSYDGQAYGLAPTRGHVTEVSGFDDQGDADAANDRWVTTKRSYDPTYGNLIAATDANGNVTTYTYGDETHALPTKVEVDPSNDTGVQATLTTYDEWTGLVTSTTDVNNQTTDIDYTNQLLNAVDPFGRPGVVTGPAVDIDGVSRRRKVFTTYEDSLRRVTVESDLRAEGDRLLKSRTTNDRLGRPVLSEQSEDGSTFTVSARSAYEQGGRVAFTSNPMREAAAAATDGWTRVTKDTAGRVKEVATFAGAARPTAAAECTAGAGCTGKVTTAYYAEFVTVTDQAGKVRRSRADALGRLVRVDEPSDENNTLGGYDSPVQPTAYAYDVLGNLTLVRQGGQLQLQNGQYQYVGGQTRSFAYGSLSRLTSATNPEACRQQQGQCAPAPTTYAYDAAGNLVRKTDPRGVSAHYSYDGLNRVTRRWYNGSDSLTATTHNSPALPAGVGASDEVRYLYDSQALPAGAPASFDRGYATGRLVATVYGGASSGTYVGYDALGRPAVSFQQTGGVNYQVGPVTYNLAGSVTSLRYPSGHTVSYNYDAAGRLGDHNGQPAFSGNLGDGVLRTYSSEVLYHATGAMSQERLGMDTPLYRKHLHNSRGQLAEIRVGLYPLTDTDPQRRTGWERGAIINSYSDTAWGVTGGGPDNNGNLKKQEVFIPNVEGAGYDQNWSSHAQVYSYDWLNRLTSAAESGAGAWSQQYGYDSYGNRTVTAAGTSNAPAPQFTVDAATNRLGVPAGQAGSMSYDVAGNLVYDDYTGRGSRAYDAENRMTAAVGKDGGTASYAYDGDGRRVRRLVGTAAEVWQVYGPGGEILAEYAKDASSNQPQKEYGYRGGELLVTAEPASAGWGPPPSFTGPDPLAKGDPILLEHLTELRSAVNQLRQHAGLSPYDFTVDPSPERRRTTVKAEHIRQLREALEAARARLGLATGGYEHEELQEKFSVIYAVDFQELRDQVRGAWQSGSSGTDIRWLVSDQLGTPRMVVDKTGSLAGIKRHDYLPFGEELSAGTGGRTPEQGYRGNVDGNRKRWAQLERDDETGLDYAQARYYSNRQGRFTSPDEFTGGPDELFDFVDVAGDNPTFYADITNPQSLNKYQYTYNNPLRYNDPTGHNPDVATEVIRWVVSVPAIPAPIKTGVILGLLPVVIYNSIPGDATQGDGSCPSCEVSLRNAQRRMEQREAERQNIRNQNNSENAQPAEQQPQSSPQPPASGGQQRPRRTVSNGQRPSSKARREVYEGNRRRNGGKLKCDECGVEMVPAKKSQKGVKPPRNEASVDHINPVSNGGTSEPSNLRGVCRGCNRDKSDTVPPR